MAKRASSSSPGATSPSYNFMFLGFRDDWYVLRADMSAPSRNMAALAFEGQVTEWLVSQRLTPGIWSHFGSGNTGEYPVLPEIDGAALYLLLKRPADVLRCAAKFACTGISPDSLLAAVQAEASVHRFVLDDAVQIAHNAIYRLAQTFGDRYPTWEELGGETRVTFTLQVKRRFEHPSEPIEQLHQTWVDQRHKDGWHYAAQFSVENRTDPLLVPWKNLNLRTQTRYHLLASVTASLAALLAS